ncbi:MAG: histidine phosphatase family protein [Spirochaetales bacterium]|nr:histidine phosphatase family protein [Spirochaetales bacterium]
MKLVLIRHGKSDWHAGKDDFFRPLNSRGMRDAPVMARALMERGITPGRLITSPAVRALTTAQLMADVFETEEVLEQQSLYLASYDEILQTAFKALEENDTVLIFGHNPGMSIAASEIRNRDTPMPTCSAAVITLEKVNDEYEVQDSYFLKPRDL